LAITQFTNDEQRNAYMALARLNNSFRNIVSVLDDMTHGVIFDAEDIIVFRGYAKELQSQVNHNLLETLRDLEMRSAFECGKVRIERENELNEERPAFGQIREPRKQRKPRKPK
jgi:hypothetical protein